MSEVQMNPNRKRRHPRQIVAYYYMSLYVLKAMVRNRATLFFGLAFPIAFVMIFGLVGNSSTSVRLGIPPDVSQSSPIIQAIKKVPIVTVTQGSKESLDNLLKQGKIDGEIVTSPTYQQGTYSVTLLTSSGNPTGSGTAQSVIRGIVDQLNLSLSGVKNPPISFNTHEISGRQSRYIDFALPGQIGFSILSLSIFGIVFGFVFLKKELIFKRMFATPVKILTILLSQGTSRLIMAFIQTIVIIGIGVFFLNFYLPHGIQTFVEILFIAAVGLVAFMGFGLFIAGFAKDENSAGPLVNLVTLPQFLLSGVFFPTDNFPTWLQPVANNLPLSYFNEAVRKVTTEGGNLFDTWTFLLGLLAWGTVMYILASRTFSWEP
jgi:ABC-2 type transport system permease protein